MMASTTLPLQPLDDEQPLSSLLSVEDGTSEDALKLSDTLFTGYLSRSIGSKQNDIEEGDAEASSSQGEGDDENDEDDDEREKADHCQGLEQNKKESSSPLDPSPDSTLSSLPSSSSSSSSSSPRSSSDATPTSTANDNDQPNALTLSDASSSQAAAAAATVAAVATASATLPPPPQQQHQASGPSPHSPLTPLAHTSPAKEHSSRQTKRNSFFSSLSALFSSRRTKKEPSSSSLVETTTTTTNTKAAAAAATRTSSFSSSTADQSHGQQQQQRTLSNIHSHSHMNKSNMSFVPSSSALFSPSLISSEVQSQLPEGYLMRPLEMTDYEKGFYDCLAGLTVVGTATAETFATCFDSMQRVPGVYHIVVIEDLSQERIVASGTLIVEQKFIRSSGKAGHIEDIVVHDSQRGKKFGIRLIDQLRYLAQQLGCYKLLLTCSESNEAFYQKSDFVRKDLHMALYLPGATSATPSSSSSSSSSPPSTAAVPVSVPEPVTITEEELPSSSSSTASSNNSSSTDVATLPALSASSCKLDIALGNATSVETIKDISILSAEPELERSTLAVH
ncbi:Glucosamine-phosphate N-acetyltransferase-like protein [Actinomortierella ambigua]|uniref:Glucosamine-phosphate N-acetyltransferase-like protein n=1 Tax=Actinomortierella ambigua TaxID=1343610 RepID=A0A9P6Q1L3_9FUNG|nr:Glucosamine-phosphate N-acetyltransferase-like protein [Actinomortierella ambigua]